MAESDNSSLERERRNGWEARYGKKDDKKRWNNPSFVVQYNIGSQTEALRQRENGDD
jgi:hypothetical protein